MFNILPNHRRLFFATDDDESFDDYTTTTIDPGDTLIIIAVFICLGSLLSLPLLVKLGKWLESRKQSSSHCSEHCKEENNAIVENTGDNQAQVTSPNISFIQRFRHILGTIIRWRSVNRREEAVSRGRAREARASVIRHEQEKQGTRVHNIDLERTIELTQTQAGEEYGREVQGGTSDLVAEEQKQKEVQRNEIFDHENSEPQLLTWRSSCLKSIGFMWKIAKYDYETMRILRLGVPFTFSAIAETVSDLIILAIISHTLGTDAMVAYAMVDMICGISSEFMGGWIEAISSLGSMAYGAKNYELVGSYVQAACIGFILCEIPGMFVWGYTTGTILGWMGFDDSVIEIAEGYVWVQVAINMMFGVNQGVLDFLEVIEYEAFANVMFCVSSLVKVALVATFAFKTDTTLVVIGLVMLVNEALFFFLNVFIPGKMGLIKKFEPGLVGRCACSNTTMLKQLVSVALPLAFGDLLAYAEWEILTVFAAILGPAEAATWAVLGFVWDVFESTTEAIGDAGEVRCSYQLGKGRSALAKLSSYKAIFIAACVALVITIIFLSLSNVLPSWLTTDETIQSMLSDLFPLIALGNITMNMGMVCWALVGAQGRYRLATSVAMACSFFITIPLAAVFTIWLKVDLQGLTFSVVVGYTITAMILSIIVLMSDWESLSQKVQDRMAVEDESDSDDDSDDDSSSSSSSINSDDQDQQPQSHSIGVGNFEYPPSFPGVLVTPPHTPMPPEDKKYARNLTMPAQRGAQYQKYRTASLPSLQVISDCLPGTPTGSESSNELDSSCFTPARGHHRPQNTMMPTRNQVNSFAKIHATGSSSVGGLLPYLPTPPTPPNDVTHLNATPNSNDQSSNNIINSSIGSPSYRVDSKLSQGQMVKGRRKRIA